MQGWLFWENRSFWKTPQVKALLGSIPIVSSIALITIETQRTRTISKQECIPVGCVPVVVYRTGVGGGHYPGRGSPGGLCLGERGSLSGRPPPPVNRMTHRCKNITLPQTSFAGGNKNPQK